MLIAGFVAIGAIAYRLTAEPSPSGGGFSIGAFLRHIVNEVRGERFEQRFALSRQEPLDSDVATLRIADLHGTLTIIGEDREDVSVDAKGSVFGVDDEAARAAARAVAMELQREGDALVLALTVPEGRERRPRLELAVRVPEHLALEVRSSGGEIEASGIAGISCAGLRGRALFSRIEGAVTGKFGPGSIEISEAEAVDLEVERTELRVIEIEGPVTLAATSGDLRIRRVTGPTKLTLERIEAELEELEGPLTVSGDRGRLRIRNTEGPIETDTSRMELFLAPGRVVPIDVTSEFETVELTLPSGGLTLDVQASSADLRLPPETLKAEVRGEDRVASGDLHGGGPLVRLRSTRGDIVIR